MPIPKTQLVAWAGGFIDGEGSISLNVGSPGHSQRKHPGQIKLYLTATNTVKAPLERLEAVFGGRIFHARARSERHKDVYMWRLANSKALAAIQEMLPFMTTRLEQAKLADEFMIGMTGTTWGPVGMPQWEIDRRVDLQKRMKALNKRGPR